jgi:hypothetical protein
MQLHIKFHIGKIFLIFDLKSRGWRRERFKKFNENGIIEFESITTFDKIPKHPKYIPFIGSCMFFSSSDFIKEVPYSANLDYLFFGINYHKII